MATVPSTIVKLWNLEHDQVAECFAMLLGVEMLKTRAGKPYRKAQFRARHEHRAAMIWSDDPLYTAAAEWELGRAYRIKVKGESTDYGPQLRVLAIEPAEGDEEYNPSCVQFTSSYSTEWLYLDLCRIIKDHVADPDYLNLLRALIGKHKSRLMQHPAAERMHHAYEGGLIEHIWSLAGLAARLADHYTQYYKRDGVTVDKSLLLSIAVLHDIGKLYELDYDPDTQMASYNVEGRLVGHVVMGRDMVRAAAGELPDFPREKLLALEHAMLSHHGKHEFGAPKLPQTLEALLFSMLDDMDAKVNQVACAFQMSSDDPEFTQKIWGLDNRRFHRGMHSCAETLDPGDEKPS